MCPRSKGARDGGGSARSSRRAPTAYQTTARRAECDPVRRLTPREAMQLLPKWPATGTAVEAGPVRAPRVLVGERDRVADASLRVRCAARHSDVVGEDREKAVVHVRRRDSTLPRDALQGALEPSTRAGNEQGLTHFARTTLRPESARRRQRNCPRRARCRTRSRRTHAINPWKRPQRTPLGPTLRDARRHVVSDASAPARPKGSPEASPTDEARRPRRHPGEGFTLSTLAFELAAFAGLRTCEVRGLRRPDVDLRGVASPYSVA